MRVVHPELQVLRALLGNQDSRELQVHQEPVVYKAQLAQQEPMGQQEIRGSWVPQETLVLLELQDSPELWVPQVPLAKVDLLDLLEI